MREPTSPEIIATEKLSAARENDLLNAIATELDDGIRQLSAGFDMAPARRSGLEALTMVCLQSGMAAEELLQFCRQRLSVDAAVYLKADVYLNADGKALQFDLWQRRAPVYPSTSD